MDYLELKTYSEDYSLLDNFHLYNKDIKHICKVLGKHFGTDIKYDNHIHYIHNNKFHNILSNRYCFHFTKDNTYNNLLISDIIRVYKDILGEDYITDFIKRHRFMLKDYYSDFEEFITKYKLIYKFSYDFDINYTYEESNNYYHNIIKRYFYFYIGTKKRCILSYYTTRNKDIILSLKDFNTIKKIIHNADSKYLYRKIKKRKWRKDKK